MIAKATNTTQSVEQLIDHLFRHESGKMVSALTRLFGIQYLEMAEDVVQDTLMKALSQWSYHGVPENPGGWLHKVAKNRALDVLRREKRKILSEEMPDSGMDAIALDLLFQESAIKDEQLRMIFTTCHPALPLEAQVALTLKTLCGFSTAEIARAFFTNEENITKRLYRAKQKFREGEIPYELPADGELPVRLEAVLKVIYLLFNEGYNSGHAEKLIRKDLCLEAMRLCLMLIDTPRYDLPEVNALMALMCFDSARFDARADEQGNIVLLKDQDRSRWNKELIDRGSHYLSRSARGNAFTEYHMEAVIASVHAIANTFESTDWKTIIEMYDALMQLKPSPVVALNKAIALAQYRGAGEALKEIKKIEGLDEYYLYHSTLGELHFQLGNKSEAAVHFKKAIELSTSNPEKELLNKKLGKCLYAQ